MEKKSSKEKTEFYREAMRDKTVGEFLNDQLYEHGMTNTGDMLSDYNREDEYKTTKNK